MTFLLLMIFLNCVSELFLKEKLIFKMKEHSKLN